MLQLGQHAVGHLEQVGAGLGELQRAPLTPPQRRAHGALQPSDGMAERRLGQVQRLGGCRQRAEPVHGPHDGEVVAIQVIPMTGFHGNLNIYHFSSSESVPRMRPMNANLKSASAGASGAEDHPQLPARYDHVGSFLRPGYLLEARARRAKGEISAGELRKVEDRAITEIVRFQEEVGLKSITDGEYR